MQNMQRYFGFRVRVSDFLEPEDYKTIKKKVLELLSQDRDDLSQYRVYLHQLVVEPSRAHFGVSGSLSRRIANFHLRFRINPKQKKTRDIKFMNYRFERQLKEEMVHYYFPHEIGYTIPGDYFDDRQYFQNVLITLVRMDMREVHKKITVSVFVEPTPEYQEHLSSKTSIDSETNFSIDFKKAVEFNKQTRLFIHQPESSMELPESKTIAATPSGTTINAKTIGAVAVNSPHSSVQATTNISSNSALLGSVLHELRLLRNAIEKTPPKEIVLREVGIIDGVIAEAPNNPEALVLLCQIKKQAHANAM